MADVVDLVSKALRAGKVCDLRKALDSTIEGERLVEVITAVDPSPHWRGLRLVGAQITGPIDLSFARLVIPLRFERCVFEGPVCFDHAELDHLEFVGSELVEGLSARRATIERNVVFGRGLQIRKGVLLDGAMIEGDLECRGCAFFAGPEEHDPALSCRWLSVDGAFVLAHLWPADDDSLLPPVFTRAHGLVDMTGARVGLLEDDIDAWPDRIRLTGFSYQRLATRPENWDIKVRLAWLGRGEADRSPWRPSRPDGPAAARLAALVAEHRRFQGQPYDQLAEVYRQSGRSVSARRVRQKKASLQIELDYSVDQAHLRAMGEQKGPSWLVAVVGQFLTYAMRKTYLLVNRAGHSARRLLLVYVGAMTLGALLVYGSPDKFNDASPALFAVDAFLPLIPLGEVGRIVAGPGTTKSSAAFILVGGAWGLATLLLWFRSMVAQD